MMADCQRRSLDKPLRARFHTACRIFYQQDFPTCTSHSARPTRSPAECDNIARKPSIAQGADERSEVVAENPSGANLAVDRMAFGHSTTGS